MPRVQWPGGSAPARGRPVQCALLARQIAHRWTHCSASRHRRRLARAYVVRRSAHGHVWHSERCRYGNFYHAEVDTGVPAIAPRPRPRPGSTPHRTLLAQQSTTPPSATCAAERTVGTSTGGQAVPKTGPLPPSPGSNAGPMYAGQYKQCTGTWRSSTEGAGRGPLPPLPAVPPPCSTQGRAVTWGRQGPGHRPTPRPAPATAPSRAVPRTQYTHPT